MKNQRYREAILKQGPDAEQKAKIWARLEAAAKAENRPAGVKVPAGLIRAAFSGEEKGEHPMKRQDTQIRDFKAKKPSSAGHSRNSWLARSLGWAAALIAVILAASLFLSRPGDESHSMKPIPDTQPMMAAAKGGTSGTIPTESEKREGSETGAKTSQKVEDIPCLSEASTSQILDVKNLEPHAVRCIASIDFEPFQAWKLTMKVPGVQEAFVALNESPNLSDSNQIFQQYKNFSESDRSPAYFVGEKKEKLYVYVVNNSGNTILRMKGEFEKVSDEELKDLFIRPDKLGVSTLKEEEKSFQDERGSFELQCDSHNAAEDMLVRLNLYQFTRDWDAFLDMIDIDSVSFNVLCENVVIADKRDEDSLSIQGLETVNPDELSAGSRSLLMKQALENQKKDYAVVRMKLLFTGLPRGAQVPDGSPFEVSYLVSCEGDESDWKIIDNVCCIEKKW